MTTGSSAVAACWVDGVADAEAAAAVAAEAASCRSFFLFVGSFSCVRLTDGEGAAELVAGDGASPLCAGGRRGFCCGRGCFLRPFAIASILDTDA